MEKRTVWLKKLLLASGELTGKQKKDLDRLVFSAGELETMAMILVKEMGEKLGKGRKLYKENRAKINDLENPVVLGLRAPVKAPPDWAARYMAELEEKRIRAEKAGMNFA